MTDKLSNWQHGIISVTILFFVSVAFYLIIIQPALKIRINNAERIDNLSFQLNKFSTTKAQIEQLKEEIKNITEHDVNKGNFLEGKAPAIIAANLQKKLKTIIETNGGNLVSTHAITGKEDDSYPKVTIKVHMQVDMKALQAVLYNLTTNKPLLFTDNLLIQSRQSSSKRKNRNSGQIEVRFDVTGYLDNSAI